ncbi:hypothetical protein PFISCL1PPCAC_13540, partial [Pristionchus fissidentatus]
LQMLYFNWMNTTLTDKYWPIFEVVYLLEIATILTCIIGSPFAAYGITHASPLHRNFRIIFLLVVFHMNIGAFSRLALIYNQVL